MFLFRTGGSGEKLIHRVHWPASLAESLSPKVSGNPVSKISWRVTKKDIGLQYLYAHAHMNVYTPYTTHTHTHDMGET